LMKFEKRVSKNSPLKRVRAQLVNNRTAHE
jgi:hypothetical protein